MTTTSSLGFVTITTSTLTQYVPTADELVLLDQVADIDGDDAVIINREPAVNGSRRIIGQHLTVTDDAWEFVQESLRQADEN